MIARMLVCVCDVTQGRFAPKHPSLASMALLLKVLELNPAIDWRICSYEMSRLLFGATCKACHERVQSVDVGQSWFLQCSLCFPETIRCRSCLEIVRGLPFWQFNGVVHYGCLDKASAYNRLSPQQEVDFNSRMWDFQEPQD